PHPHRTLNFRTISLTLRETFLSYGSQVFRQRQQSRSRRQGCSRFALFLAGINPDSLRFNAQPTFESSLTLDSSASLWPTPVQLSSAIALTLPLILSSTQVQSPFHFSDSTDQANQPEKPAISEPEVKPIPVVAPLPLARPKPTGIMANIQTYHLPAKGEFTSGYGWRWGRLHRGIDIAGPVGTPVLAAAAGKVITAGWDNSGFGNRIEIRHPDGTVTLYGHNQTILTKVGAWVKQGQQIAEMGATGHSTGSHVHFQIHPHGKDAVDPMFFMGSKIKTLPIGS
ncbi:MAG: M23 family metallopeptidase, partial [Thermosynechococcaceae cyanobacterium]